jgi:hypothetical protein
MLDRFRSSEQKAVRRFTKYLNGPLGRTVMNDIEEGESFILQTQEYQMRVTKKKGRAVVEIIEDEYDI